VNELLPRKEIAKQGMRATACIAVGVGLLILKFLLKWIPTIIIVGVVALGCYYLVKFVKNIRNRM
jgi:hypothetical protein